MGGALSVDARFMGCGHERQGGSGKGNYTQGVFQADSRGWCCAAIQIGTAGLAAESGGGSQDGGLAGVG